MKPKVINLIQGSEEWKQFRKSHITATDSGIVMNLSPFCTPYQLWQRKLGLIPEQEINQAMKEGSKLEDEARLNINEFYKCMFKPVVLVHAFCDFMMASLDGMNEHGEVLEIKCGVKSHKLAKDGIIPEYYMSQLQKIMFVSDTRNIRYFSYRSPIDYIHINVSRDDEFIEKMIIEEKKFYDCLMNLTPPEVIDKEYWTMNARK